MGTWPAKCDICKTPLDEEQMFIDGRIIDTWSWALMCLECHITYGAGLGTGNGQLYASNDRRKVAG